MQPILALGTDRVLASFVERMYLLEAQVLCIIWTLDVARVPASFEKRMYLLEAQVLYVL